MKTKIFIRGSIEISVEVWSNYFRANNNNKLYLNMDFQILAIWTGH